MDGMIDLHTHTCMSDGVLCTSELARRCQHAGYEGLVISDHCDHANLKWILDGVCAFCEAVEGQFGNMRILPGCELTHVPPALIGELIRGARDGGAKVVLVHGETIVEPVAPGTNRAAIEGGADVIAHPGLISEEDVVLAAEKGVLLEISGRKGHSFTNGYVASLALAHGARLSFGSDGHAPGEYPDRAQAERIMRGAGLDDEQVARVFANCAEFFPSP